jgi:cell division protein FtsL
MNENEKIKELKEDIEYNSFDEQIFDKLKKLDINPKNLNLDEVLGRLDND